jgi:tRNA dimethylallyltransferase
MERDALAERIRSRAAAMLGPETAEEVGTAIERGASRTARKAMGFKEIAAHLAGDIDAPETRAILERRHLAYAKRQLTWMRKLANVRTLDRTDLDGHQTAAALVEQLDSLPASK